MVQKLLKYQEVDARLKKIENELLDSEDRKKASSAKKYLAGVEENVNKLDDRAKELALTFESLKQTEAKLNEQCAEFSKALESVADETEASYHVKKIEKLLKEIKALQEQSASVSAEIEGLLKEYAKIKATSKVAQEQLKENGAKYNELKASKSGEMEAIKKELEGLAKDVPVEIMEKYLKKRSEKIFPVLLEASEYGCSACGMELPMSAINKLKNGEIIECDCGRLLYK